MPSWPAPTSVGALDARQTSPPSRFATRVRWLFARGLAGVLAGVVVLGVGGRLVMLLSRLLHPDTVGRLTENGNVIGEVTLGGTLGLVVFGGLVGGVAGGIVWALVAPWLPRRWWSVGLATTALGGPFLVAADNRDFVVLSPPVVDLALLLGLLFLFGAAVHVVDGRLEARLRPDPSPVVTGLRAGAVLLAANLLVPVFGFWFSTSFCFCDHPPRTTGGAMVVVALSSGWWWFAELRGRDRPPSAALVGGRVGLAVALLASAVDLGTEVLLVL